MVRLDTKTITGSIVELSTKDQPHKARIDQVEVTLKVLGTTEMEKFVWFKKDYESLGRIIFPALKTHKQVTLFYKTNVHEINEILTCNG